MKKLLLTLAGPLLGLSLLSAGALAIQPIDRIVAVVNDDVILATELDAKTRLIRDQLLASNTQPPADEVLRKQVLERLVVDRLQLQLARSNSILVSDETLNANLLKMAQQNQLSLPEFRAALEAEGHKFPLFREDIRSQIIINQLRQRMVVNRITVSDQEIDHLLESQQGNPDQQSEYRLGHILIAVPEGASATEIGVARAKAEVLLGELRGGADFAQLAVAESAGQNALEGGDLGWRRLSQLPTLFAEIVADMAIGDTSEPIRSPSGFHLIQLVDKRGDERMVVTQTRVRHILLRPDEVASESAVRERLNQLRTRIAGGEDFAALARSHSHDTVSASRGGDLDWVSPGVLVPEFEQVMEGLSIGEVSAPVQTRYGWHIMEVLERRAHDSTEEFQRNSAREFIRKRKTDEELELWLRRLRDEAYVEYRLDDD